MKSAIAGIVAVVALAVTAVSTAGPSSQPQASAASITSLQKQLKRTNARVKKLETRVKRLEARSQLLTTVAVATLAGVACEAVITAEAFQRTWAVVDEMAQATQQKTYFGPQPAMVEHKSCSDLEIPRQQPPPAAPTLRGFQEVVNLFYGP
jgi:hypothetical protein